MLDNYSLASASDGNRNRADKGLTFVQSPSTRHSDYFLDNIHTHKKTLTIQHTPFCIKTS